MAVRIATWPPMALSFVLLVLLFASCVQTAAVSESHRGSRADACLAPRAILAGPSAFETALDLWSRDPVGSARALAALDRACDDAADQPIRGTEHAACAVLGLIHLSGEGVARDPHAAFRYLSRGARCGMSFDAMDLAQAEGHAITGNSVGCCGGRSCEAGCEDECARASAAVQAALVPPIERACAAGRGVGCFLLSELVAGQGGGQGGEYIQMVGRVVSSSKLSDEALWDRACRGGVGPACQRLAYRTDEHDEPRRAHYTQRACDLGWGDACLQIGMTLDRAGARGKAIPHWERACKLGLTRVCGEVADMLSKGDGVPKDPARASELEAETWRVH